MAINFRERALEASLRDVGSTAKLISRHFDYRFREFSVLQHEVVERLRQLPTDGVQVDLGSAQTHEWLRAKVSGASDIAGINVFDARGVLTNSSERWPVGPMDVSDRQYFQFLRKNSRISSKIELLQGRFAPGLAIVFANAVRAPQTDRFLGVVTRAIDPATLHEFFASIALRRSAAIALFHNDGTLLARYPEVEGALGKVLDLSPLYERQTAGLQMVSPIDGSNRLMAAHSLADFPLTVVVSTDMASALTDWRTQTKFLIAAASLAALVIGTVLALIIKQLLFQHHSARRHLNTALNNMTQGLISYDSAERVIFCNDEYLQMCGLSRQLIKPGCTFLEVLKQCQVVGSLEANTDALRRNLLDDLKTGKIHETVSETSDGRYFHAVNKPLRHGGWVTTIQDITERTLSQKRILHLAHHDTLTGLANRELFREELERSLLSLNAQRKLALIYMDIDQFKSVNDSLGHPVGDAFLKSIATRLSDCLGESDFIARLGGDEFAVLHRGDTEQTKLADFVSNLLEQLRRPHWCGDHLISADASVGIAVGPMDGSSPDELIKNADLAMYAAKAQGRRSFRFFSPEMDANAKARRALEVDLRSAIPNDELEVHYQPLVDLRSGAISGCEALLRWRHPQGGFVSPATFVPIAEETGLIVQLGDWVLKTACMEAAAWPPNVSIAVNVSPVQLRCPTLPLTLAAALGMSGLLPNRLELEITEAVLIHDDEAALEVLHQIKALGVKVSLDDFGTGYSSLSYLRRFPFDKIKIDKSFIKDIAVAGGASVIVEAVVKIANDHAMQTTAEGVETEEQLSRVRQLGCTQMQGFLYSPPRPPQEIREMVWRSGARAPAAA